MYTELCGGVYNPYFPNPVAVNEYELVEKFQIDHYEIQYKQCGFSNYQYLLIDLLNPEAHVGYLSYNSYEIVSLYIWPEYRERNLAKFLLSITPKNLDLQVQPFRKYEEENLVPTPVLESIYDKYYTTI